jgi:hypothetical protein
MTEARVTVREVLRLLLEADSYPCPGNEDWAVAARMEAAALAKAETAVASPDDPPEFALGCRPCDDGRSCRSTSAKKSIGPSMIISPRVSLLTHEAVVGVFVGIRLELNVSVAVLQ